MDSLNLPTRFFQLSEDDFNLPKRSETFPPSNDVGIKGDGGKGLSERLCDKERDSCNQQKKKRHKYMKI